MLAMVVNDNEGYQAASVVWTVIASMLAPTGAAAGMFGAKRQKSGRRRKTVAAFLALAPAPFTRSPVNRGFAELARRLLKPSYEKSGLPKVSRHEHQLR